MEALGSLGCRHAGVCLTVGGAEEPGLVEVQLLQLLWVLGQRCREQQLLQGYLRRRQTGRTNTADGKPSDADRTARTAHGAAPVADGEVG